MASMLPAPPQNNLALPAPPALAAIGNAPVSSAVATSAPAPAAPAPVASAVHNAGTLLAIGDGSAGAVAAPTAPATSSGAAAGVFTPSYQWQVVPPGASVPPGLEVRLAVDGTGSKTARIPPNWRVLVVTQENDSCRTDVTPKTSLTELRTAIAARLAPKGDPRMVAELFLDGVLLAGGTAGEEAWALTIEQAGVFGRRVTCSIVDFTPQIDAFNAHYDGLGGKLDQLAADVAQLERALQAQQITAGRAHDDLAQIEAELDRLQCKGIDCADNPAFPGGQEAAKVRRRELTQRAELLHTRIGGIFVGLKAAKAAQTPQAALPSAQARQGAPAVTNSQPRSAENNSQAASRSRQPDSWGISSNDCVCS